MLKNPKRIELLYRASDFDFMASAFHLRCDNIEDTLVIARTDKKRTIAGFTHYKWNHVIGAVNDPGKRTFLLQLDLH